MLFKEFKLLLYNSIIGSFGKKIISNESNVEINLNETGIEELKKDILGDVNPFNVSCLKGQLLITLPNIVNCRFREDDRLLDGQLTLNSY